MACRRQWQLLSPEVNEQYYTFDVSTMREKTKIVEKVTNVM